MRIVFAGTPAFAEAALRALLDAGHDLALVLTRPDRPAGRGLRHRPSEVKALAIQRGLPLVQPATLNAAEVREVLRGACAQVMVVAAYGLILPQSVLDLFHWLHQHSRLVAASLARRCPDPTRHPGR
jgi:methionyl-tRNA formyltransferase